MRPITWGPPSGTEKTGNITFPQTTYAGGIYTEFKLQESSFATDTFLFSKQKFLVTDLAISVGKVRLQRLQEKRLIGHLSKLR